MARVIQKQTDVRAAPANRVNSYWERTQWPLQSLYFLLPLIVGYELGTLAFAPVGTERLPPIYAQSMLGRFFEWFGMSGYYLPGVAVVLLLLGLHLVRRESWRPEPLLYGAMFIESAVLAAPLFVFSVMLSGESPPAALHGLLAASRQVTTGLEAVPTWQAGAVFAIGAGIYEELIFRLIAIALLHFILADLLGLAHRYAAGIAIGVSAIAFALYHPFDSYNLLAWSSADWGRGAFYTLAGLYFAAIYVYRGFGIVVATHALYDLMVIAVHFSTQ